MSTQQPASSSGTPGPSGTSGPAGPYSIVPLPVTRASEIAGLERALFPLEAWDELMLREEIDHPLRTYLAVTDVHDALIGYGGVMVVGDVADLHTIGIRPDAQGHGLGRRLLAALEDAARGRGAETMMLEVRVDNDSARSLYTTAGYGFVTRRRNYYPSGDGGRVDAIIMRKRLA